MYKMIKIDHIVNRDDIEEHFWKTNYIVHVSAQDIIFSVNADCEQDALDFIMDYIVEHEMTGLYCTPNDERMDCK